MPQHDDMLSRYSRASVSLDSLGSQTDEESSNPSPASANAIDSPNAGYTHSSGGGAGGGGAMGDGDGGSNPDEERNSSSSGPQNTSSVSRSKPEKEKRKRSRVTPEQLVHLERFFLMDRSPTAPRRRDISELLGMQERQTQIWFQNRRAKAKLQDTKQGGQMDYSHECSPSLYSPRHDSDVLRLIHEDEPVSIIHCTDLNVGTWRRIENPDTHDLIAYICESRRCLSWFIHSGGYGFKMELPFDTIIDTEHKLVSPRTGMVSLTLSQPPTFYLENIVAGVGDDRPPIRTWKRCSDWTEGHQASQVLRHTVIGSDAELTYVLRSLLASGNPDIARAKGAYRPDHGVASPMEIPPPPLAGLNNAYRNMDVSRSAADLRKRPSYPPSTHHHQHHQQQHPDDRAYSVDRADLQQQVGAPPHSAPAAPLSHHNGSFMRPIHHSSGGGPSFESGVYSPAGASDYTTNGHHDLDTPTYSASIPSPQPPPPALGGGVGAGPGVGAYARSTPYAAAQQPPSYFSKQPGEGMHLSPRISQNRAYANPSPPLLGGKYHQDVHAAHRDSRLQQHPVHQGPSPPLSGMPGIMYGGEGGMYSR